MANDLIFKAYAHKLRTAGYPVNSFACSVGRHDDCSGLAQDEKPCGCSCHEAV
jgi:hypothetical protein